MSRTYRKREYYKDESDLNLLKLLLSEIEKDNKIYYVAEDGSYANRVLNMKIYNFLNKYDFDTAFKKIKEFIVSEIKSEERYLKKLTTDKRNWRGNTIRLTKEYSNMKSRSGKREVLNTILKNIDLKEIDSFVDINYFAEPKLGSIKGAIWNFD